MTKAASLRRSLLRQLAAPLVAVMVMAGAGAYFLAQHYSQRVLDQWLLDSAVTLAKQVRFVAGEAQIDIPGRAIEMFEVDLTDRVYYEVTSGRGTRILANAPLPAPPGAIEPGEPVFYDGAVTGVPVRVIALAIPAGAEGRVLVKVAETRRKRDELARSILWSTVLMLAALVAAALALIGRGIGTGLASLEAIVRRVRGRPGPPLARLPRDESTPSEVHPLLDAINELLGELEREHVARQRFIADAAHQLRTPLASLGVQLALAERETDPGHRTRAIANARGVLERTAHVISRLLALARADQAAEGGAREPVDLNALARESVEAWYDRALAAGTDLGIEAPAGPVTVAGNAAFLREALSNLVDNALAHGRQPGRVTVVVGDDPPSIAVEDDGPGIAPAERERVFERFYRTPGTRGEGAGLGLAIVAEIARAHGATVSVEPRDPAGAGTRVRLRFPPPEAEGGSASA
jgi:two-component system sensor histidine kinase TctE